MAIDHVGGVGGTVFERSANLPSGNYTMMGWFYLITGNPGLSALMARTDTTSNPSNFEVIGFDGGTNPLTLFSTTGNQLVRTLDTARWFFIALRLNGTTVTAHTRYADENTFTTGSRSTSSFTPVRFALGTDYFGDPVPDMRSEQWTIFSADIGETECLIQSFSRGPQRFTNLDSYVPLETTAYTSDYSGNARAITSSGSAGANAPGPYVPRQVRSRARKNSTGAAIPPLRPMLRAATGTILRGGAGLLAA